MERYNTRRCACGNERHARKARSLGWAANSRRAQSRPQHMLKSRMRTPICMPSSHSFTLFLHHHARAAGVAPVWRCLSIHTAHFGAGPAYQHGCTAANGTHIRSTQMEYGALKMVQQRKAGKYYMAASAHAWNVRMRWVNAPDWARHCTPQKQHLQQTT
eukprot:358951-Chlamydomonas_euryale.AAC.5